MKTSILSRLKSLEGSIPGKILLEVQNKETGEISTCTIGFYESNLDTLDFKRFATPSTNKKEMLKVARRLLNTIDSAF